MHAAVGGEGRYLLHVAECGALGVAVPGFAIHVFDLGHDDIDGLVGLNLLSEINYEVRSAEQRISPATSSWRRDSGALSGATPIGSGRASLATSNRRGVQLAVRLARLVRPLLERSACRLWDDDRDYSEGLYELRTRER